MREFAIKLFSNEAIGPEITLFGFWHIIYIILILGITLFVYFFLKKKNNACLNKKVINFYAIAVLFLYISDFFIQPFYNNDNMIIDKLPFHICTLMCPMIILTRWVKGLEKLRTPISVLSLVASLMYLTYPGSALGDISVFSYKVVQTFMYHGFLFGYGFLTIVTKEVTIEYKKIYKELFIIIGIILWAFLGNTLYSTDTHVYDWFFVNAITFPFIPKALMPFVVLVSVFGMVNIIYLLYFGIKKINDKRLIKKAVI